jgi:hypothetical protein
MVRDDHLGAAAEVMEPLLSHFRRFDFDIDGVGSGIYRLIQNGQLLFYAAVKLPMVLVAAAGSEDDAIRELLQKAANGRSAFARPIQEIQAKFQENLARLGFPPRVVEQCLNVWQAQRNANAGERPCLRHLV